MKMIPVVMRSHDNYFTVTYKTLMIFVCGVILLNHIGKIVLRVIREKNFYFPIGVEKRCQHLLLRCDERKSRIT